VNLIAKGAEGDLYEADFEEIYFESTNFSRVIIKKRIPKGYRVPELDLQLRRQRTISEAKVIHEARGAGVNVPTLLGIWTDECTLVMEKLEGPRLKELLIEGADGGRACFDAGRQIGRLHGAGLVHGDPTTSNMILVHGAVFLIDFGLAEFSDSIEKRAVDLHILKTALKSTHFAHFRELYSFALDGYREEMGDFAAEILQRCESIEKRGRYFER
jgi:TP53 regulating kinase-like protein